MGDCNWRTIYRVYEISPDCRKYGRVVRDFKTLKGAINCTNKSIYRYYLEKRVLEFTISL